MSPRNHRQRAPGPAAPRRTARRLAARRALLRHARHAHRRSWPRRASASTSRSATAGWSPSATPPSSASAATPPASSPAHALNCRAAVLAFGHPRHHLDAGHLAVGDRRRRPGRAAHRRPQPAHRRRLLHHDHARLRADDLLSSPSPGPPMAARTACRSTSATAFRASNTASPWPSSYLLRVLLLRSACSGCCALALRPRPRRRRGRTRPRLAAVGIAPFNVRLTAFVISAMVTGLAGALYADLNRFVSPSMLSWHLSGELIVFVILGGNGRLCGPVAGAMLYVLLENQLGGSPNTGSSSSASSCSASCCSPAAASSAWSPERRAMAEPILEIRGLGRPSAR